jgi:pyrroline-5-carboxylate reductase
VSEIPSLLLVGCGRMGSAMLAGWRERGLDASFAVDPAPDAARNAGADLTVVSTCPRFPPGSRPAAVVLAVKPQSAAEVLPAYARFAGSAVFLSIMAGRTIGGIQALLGGSAAIVRAMPNTPAAVRQGVTVATPSASVTSGQRSLCENLLRAIGLVEWVEQEDLLDPVTAVSGSGPPTCSARRVDGAGGDRARHRSGSRARTGPPDGGGSGALLAASSESAAELRTAVTSPGGTTEAALKVLMAPDALPKAFSEAIAAATRRSRELAG